MPIWSLLNMQTRDIGNYVWSTNVHLTHKLGVVTRLFGLQVCNKSLQYIQESLMFIWHIYMSIIISINNSTSSQFLLGEEIMACTSIQLEGSTLSQPSSGLGGAVYSRKRFSQPQWHCYLPPMWASS
jgi:hypothetical protein